MARTEQSNLVTHGRRLTDLGVAIIEAIERAGGGDDDARRIFKDPLLSDQIGLLVMGKLKLGQFPSEIYAADLIPEYTDKDGKKRKWEIVEDVEPSATPLEQFRYRSFLKDGEPPIDGKEMRTRAVTMKGNRGLADAKRFLAVPDKIPVEMHDLLIVFSGTVLRDPDGRLYVPCLYWDGDRWFLCWYWLVDDWRGSDRLPCSE